MAGDRLLELQPGASFREAFKGRFWAGRIDSIYVGILMPATFMNASGDSAARAADRNHVDVSHVVVVYDDMDLDFGLLRIRVGGSSGGHLGVKSIVDQLDSPDFVRVRMGVGRPPKSVDPVDFLLDDFLPSELPQVNEMIDLATAAVVDLLHRPTGDVMNEFNRKSIEN
jgi:PTH1 family peptidyl-tRNA hydrolase